VRNHDFLVLQHRVWNALRRGDRLTVAQAAERWQYRKSLAARYLRALVTAGWAASERIAGVGGQPSVFWLVQDLGPFPPRFGTGRVLTNPNQAGQVSDPHQRLWNALRIQRRGRWSDFAAPAEVCQRMAVRYLDALRRVGYVLAVRSPGRVGWLIWSLAKDSGPVAPVVLETGVYDPNLDLTLEVEANDDAENEAENGEELRSLLDGGGRPGVGGLVGGGRR